MNSRWLAVAAWLAGLAAGSLWLQSLAAGVVLGGLLHAAGYVAASAWWPLAPCLRCKGEGKFRSWLNKRTWRKCPRCGGQGDRVRWGRRVWDRMRDRRRAAARAK